MRPLYLFCLLACFRFSAFGQTAPADSTGLTQRVFKLGEVVISGRQTEENTTVTSEQLESFNRLDVSHALNLLPGVNLAGVGARNESVVLVRGFDLRQVPVFIDGVPVYVPYDGYVDLARFTTFDVAQINVAKGFSSVTYGANTLGGAINIVSRKPLKKLELETRAGWLSRQGQRLSLNVGSNLGKFYVQGSASRLKQETFPLADDFTPKENEDGKDRDNAYREDAKYTLKVGFTPREKDEYALSYVNQRGRRATRPTWATTRSNGRGSGNGPTGTRKVCTLSLLPA
ncbi:TonB-dependent receptor plug domain-containing protein [Adhaeribacter swui]|uniref:TonB-dependent receptor plug domain-containing protein n=1 Tax=Adhaeribacter swui TaxID=2086471 RepID=UPI001E284273|nr:TonB-dependent receptor [Adhaeribacter swui]